MTTLVSPGSSSTGTPDVKHSNDPVPFVDLAAQQREVNDEIQEVLQRVFAATAFIGGPDVASFEREFADYIGAGHCVGVGNGTDALELALRATGVTQGDEVILPANTFIATAEAVCRIGAVPVLVDVDPEFLLIDVEAANAAINRRTRAIIPVHLYGQPAFVEKLMPRANAVGVTVIEDAAQAQGAMRLRQRAGTLGDAAGTSFYPGKNLGAAGDAGAVVTDDADLADRVRILSEHGSPEKYRHTMIGMNSRLDTIQAVVLRAKLRRLDVWNEARRSAAERYTELLADMAAEGHVVLPREAEGNRHVWHLYTIRVEHRDEILDALRSAGIGVGVHYPTPIHRTDAFRDLGKGTGSFPVAEVAADRLLSLPMYPHLTLGQQERVVEALSRAVMGRAANQASVSSDRT